MSGKDNGRTGVPSVGNVKKIILQNAFPGSKKHQAMTIGGAPLPPPNVNKVNNV